jgi:hypothetical protein
LNHPSCPLERGSKSAFHGRFELDGIRHSNAVCLSKSLRALQSPSGIPAAPLESGKGALSAKNASLKRGCASKRRPCLP